MKLKSLGISVASQRDAGSHTLYVLSFPAGANVSLVSEALDAVPVDSELSAADPLNSDCEFEVKRTSGGFSIKRGCHGAAGTWRDATIQEASDWLFPAIAHAVKKASGTGHAQLAVFNGV